MSALESTGGMPSADSPGEISNRGRLGLAFERMLSEFSDPVTLLDREWRYAYVNEKAVEVLGKRSEDLVGRSVWEVFPEARETQFYHELKEVARTGKALRSEQYYPPMQRWFENQMQPAGEYVAVISRDITEKKRSAENLDRHRAELALALRAGQMGTWEWNLGTGEVKWSDEVFALLGYVKGRKAPTYAAWLERLHPEDSERVIREYEECFKQKAEYVSEYRVIWPDLSVHWIHVRGRHILDEAGHAIRISGVLFDITRSKEAHAHAQRMERIYRAIGESIDYGIWVCDPEGKNIYASDSFLKLVGLTQEECSAFGWGTVLHPEDAMETIAAWQKCAREGSFWEREHRFKGVDGEWHSVLARGLPIRNESGRIDCWAGINLDISAWKASQQALREKEEFNRRIIESSRDCIKVLSLEGNLLWMNEQGAQLLCLPEVAGVVGKSWIVFWEGETRQAASRAVEAAAAGGTASFVGCFRVNGQPRWWDVRVTPILDTAGRPKELLAVSRDITERREAEEALRESEERLRLAMEAGAIGTWDWDIQGESVEWSDRTCQLHGLKPGEFSGKVEEFTRLVHPEDLARVRGAIEAALKERAPYAMEFRVVHPSGVVRWLTTSAKVLFDASGQPRRMIGATADVTERKQLEQELLADQRKLTEHAQLLEQQVALRTSHLHQTVQSLEGVAYTIAHDLRAPLRALSGFAQLVREDYGPALDETGKGYLNNIAHSAARMDNLINDLLAYAKLSHSDLPLEQVCLDEKVQRLCQELEPEIRARHASVTVRAPLGQVIGNRTVLRQVIMNLITNGIKFVEAGVPPKIEIWSEPGQDEGMVRLYLRDNGIGISTEYQEKIFGLFQRLHDQQVFQGTGLGLAIVKKGMERMGGAVGLASQEGKGSCFWIELPAARARKGRQRDVAAPAEMPEQ